MTRPVVAITFGDASGIGPELVAKFLSRPEILAAQILLVGDAWVWAQGQKVACVSPPVKVIKDWSEARDGDGTPMLLEMQTVAEADIIQGQVTAAAGRGARLALTACLDAAVRGDIDAVCFAPLNKQAMKKGGMAFEDEQHFFADHMGVTGYFCEFNALGTLWTSRISSHIPLADIPKYVTKDRIKAAARLTFQTLKRAGFAQPRVALAALNPHGGDGGTCGREEIDIIEPAARELNDEGLPIQGPFPADTIFLKARDGLLDSIVTMYHDQGQVAVKLLGFERGVTVAGGLPVPITTPAHGTAFDIVGQGKAKDEAMTQAFLLAAKMGAAHLSDH
ncbi:MAG: 4-hydroxythreonine-4-phosphate dehydrogenase PdxA [Alphaproteobacteria bacterium]|nr:4-hydroxythreonine-4-phosphate dehydrogenase PdxA [Alphaproteobacteria bacterium]